MRAVQTTQLAASTVSSHAARAIKLSYDHIEIEKVYLPGVRWELQFDAYVVRLSDLVDN